MRAHLGVIAALLSFSACAIAQEGVPSATSACSSQICELTKTLGNLNLTDPISDLDENLKGGDRRFIGIRGYSCVAPGADKADEPWSPKFGMRCLEGTSDMVEGDPHLALIDKAVKYARIYNSELLRRIRAGLVT